MLFWFGRISPLPPVIRWISQVPPEWLKCWNLDLISAHGTYIWIQKKRGGQRKESVELWTTRVQDEMRNADEARMAHCTIFISPSDNLKKKKKSGSTWAIGIRFYHTGAALASDSLCRPLWSCFFPPPTSVLHQQHDLNNLSSLLLSPAH